MKSHQTLLLLFIALMSVSACSTTASEAEKAMEKRAKHEQQMKQAQDGFEALKSEIESN